MHANYNTASASKEASYFRFCLFFLFKERKMRAFFIRLDIFEHFKSDQSKN